MALDPVARLILDEAGPLTERTLVLDDRAGALTRELLDRGVDVVAWCDDLRDERELPIPGLATLDAASLAGVQTVLLRLPTSIAALQEYAELIAARGAPTIRVVAGGREKHLSRGMNDALAARFDHVRASLGRQKSRVLHAWGARPGSLTWPRTRPLAELQLTLVSHGAVFAAERLDAGTRLLLSALPGARRGQAVDLGCGSGILAAWLARRGDDVRAVDVSWAACASTRATAAANDLRVDVARADGLESFAEASVDLVVCNPPFHRGAEKDSTPGFALLRSAIPALAPGGELWTVFNSHLPYLPFLRAEVGPTAVATRDRHYTVTRSVRTAGAAQR